MKYTVKINGKTYELPARTEEMDRIVHRMTNIERLANCGELARQEALREQYDFVSMCIPEDMPAYADIDVSDLEIARLEIVTAYNEPVVKAKVDTMMESVRAVVNKPEIRKLLLLAEANLKNGQV